MADENDKNETQTKVDENDNTKADTKDKAEDPIKILEEKVDRLADGAEKAYRDARRSIDAQGGLGNAASNWWNKAKTAMGGKVEEWTGKAGRTTVESTGSLAAEGAKDIGGLVAKGLKKAGDTEKLPNDAPLLAKVLYGTGVIVQKTFKGATNVVKYVVEDIKGPEPVPQFRRSKALLEDYIVSLNPAKAYSKQVKDEDFTFDLSVSDRKSGEKRGTYSIVTKSESTEMKISFYMDEAGDIYDRKKDLTDIMKHFVVVANDLLNEEIGKGGNIVRLSGQMEGNERYGFTATRELATDKDIFAIEFVHVEKKGAGFSYKAMDTLKSKIEKQ